MTAPWYKYTVEDLNSPGSTSRDQSVEEHVKTFGGLGNFEEKLGQPSFFSTFISPSYQHGRLKYYDQFLRKHLKMGETALSLASGPAVNELALLQDGFSIECSDLKQLPYHSKVKEHYSGFQFQELNILETSPLRQYDTVFTLSLIYLFNENELEAFFKNVSQSLKPGGRFLLEVTGSPTHLFTSLFHERYLQMEATIKWLILRVSGRPARLQKKHHGYRRTDKEVIAAARLAGFELVEVNAVDNLSDLKRSYVISKILDRAPALTPVFETMAKLLQFSFLRTFVFLKLNTTSGGQG